MALSRISLDEDIREIIDAIQAKTRATSPSMAIAILATRYGRHLIETWEVLPERCPDPLPAQYATAQPSEIVFTDPIEGL